MMTLNRLSIIIAVIVLLTACHKASPPVPLKQSDNFKRAEQFLASNQIDSAFYYYNEVTLNAKDSLETAMAFNHLAAIQSDAGDYYGAQESSTASLKFLNEQKASDRYCLAADYNELAMTSSKLKNYDQALNYYDQALKFCDNKDSQLILLNNKANVYQRKKDYPRALTLYQNILAQNADHLKEYARTLTNLSTTQWLANPAYPAATPLRKALGIRIRLKDQWGQNSSFAHLADFYETKRADSALFFARQMYAIAKQLNSPDDQLEALQKLIKLSPSNLVQSYFARYQTISDSLTTVRNAAKNQFALIRYQAQKNQLANLKLQKDNTEKKYQLTIKNTIIYSSFSLFVLVVIMLTYRYNKKKQQAVQENQLRLTTKVHNRLANGIYQLMQEIDNHDGYDKEMIVQELNILYERSRDLAHEQDHLSESDFTEKIDQLLTAFAGPGINLAIVGNELEYWQGIDGSRRGELEQVLQEWMVNMKKHSQANSVSVQFFRNDKQIEIFYTDNGIGLPPTPKKGKGMQFAENRIKMLGGSINFDTKSQKGTRISLTLPLG